MTMAQTLIVARADRSSLGRIGAIFAQSDGTDLPLRVGVRERSLFHFHDLYFHLIRSDVPVQAAIENVRTDPLWLEVIEELSELVTPYSPEWRSPRDAMAQQFYHWTRGADR